VNFAYEPERGTKPPAIRRTPCCIAARQFGTSSTSSIGTPGSASFSAPLARSSSGQWYFDAAAGAQEIRTRDIGRNELLAIDACAAIANAQETYFATVGSTPHFAQRIVSTSGKQDGLYWPASQTEGPSPLGSFDEFPTSSLDANPPREALAVDGYRFRILTAQGDAAPAEPRATSWTEK